MRAIPEALAAHLAEGWALERLDRPLRQLLRAGVYELIARPDVPTATVINEYLDGITLQDLLDQNAGRLDMVTTLVLDEADQMLDKGFLPAIRRLLKAIPAQRQTIAASPEEEASVRAMAEALKPEVK